MNSKAILRILVATQLISGIAISVITSYTDSEPMPPSDIWTSQDAWNIVVGLPLFALVLVSFYGMFVFWKRAPLLYLLLAVGGLIHDAVVGQEVNSFWVQLFDDIALTLHAIILGLVYFSPLKNLYGRDKSALTTPLASFFQHSDAARKAGLAPFFQKIATPDDALKTIVDASKALYLLGAISLLASIALNHAYAFDAGFFVVLAFCLRRWNSRVAAMLLALLGPVMLVNTTANYFGGSEVDGKNVFLAILVMLISIRTLIATFKLPRLLAK